MLDAGTGFNRARMCAVRMSVCAVRTCAVRMPFTVKCQVLILACLVLLCCCPPTAAPTSIGRCLRCRRAVHHLCLAGIPIQAGVRETSHGVCMPMLRGCEGIRDGCTRKLPNATHAPHAHMQCTLKILHLPTLPGATGVHLLLQVHRACVRGIVLCQSSLVLACMQSLCACAYEQQQMF